MRRFALVALLFAFGARADWVELPTGWHLLEGNPPTSSGVTNSAGANVIPKSDGTNLVASNLTDSGTNLAYTSTIPSAADGAKAAAQIVATATGGSFGNYGLYIGLSSASYIGQAAGINVVQTTPTTSLSYTGEGGIKGIYVESSSLVGASGGTHTGIYGWGKGNSINYGVIGRSTAGGVRNIGVIGFARDGSSANTGGVFSLRVPDGDFPSAGLVCDNGSLAVPIFIARDNVTAVFTIKDGGIVNISNTPTYADNAAATTGGLAAGDVYRTSTGVLMITY